MSAKRALFVSPHLDDVAFSVGGAFAALSQAGWHTILLTVFTSSVPDPQGFALACQTDKGIPPEVDYMALRRAEDQKAAEILGAAEVIHLDHAEAPHRGYDSKEALFGEPFDEIALDLPEADELFLPQGIGGHVDHLLVVRATNQLKARRYRELPYGLKDAAEAEGDAFAPSKRKLDACAAYASQLDFQFGGEAKMRAALGGAQERVTRSAPGPSPDPGRAAPP
jgi:LmbE family N-acetylglucosaminyl deacetylase